uniref:Putative transmembrane protein n=1 Tax=Ralstonia solanacearum TaxID=305 RepID=A0A0S4WXM2_RALSL|nr:putative transmembrane protein [Ralstonia solanacearum]
MYKRQRLAPPKARIRAAYENQVSRKLEGGGQVPWQRAQREGAGLQGGWDDSARERSAAAMPWQPTVTLAGTVQSAGGDNQRARSASRVRWQGAAPAPSSTADRINPLVPQHAGLGLPWGEGAALSGAVLSPFVWLVPCSRGQSQVWQLAVPLALREAFGFSPGRWQSGQWSLPWELGRQPRPGESHLPVDPPVVEPAPRYHPDLDFICRATRQGLAWRPVLWLDFGAHPCGEAGAGVFSVPILKVYFVSNSVDVVRLPGREPIPVKSVRLSIDEGSWAWGLSASLPYAALEMVEPTASGPVEIEITINGVTWVMLVEGFDVRREFGQASLDIRGRSTAAYLAEPYAPKRSFVPAAPFTARQLAEQELTRTGLVTGFTLDWRLPDWLVPEGSWGYQSLSPMGVIGRIVEAAGGYVNAHPRLRTLVAKSRYPVLPWNWATEVPDRMLPIDVVKTLNLRWQEKPTFNAVYVCGERQGVTGHVVRAGTAGDLVAPTAVDALITHADAARERARPILADVGRQAVVTLELPMLSSLGLLDPGLLLAIGEGGKDWRGLVRATSIAADWNESLTVRQTIEVQRYYL